MKLLNLTTRNYGIFFGLLLLISIPLFYLGVQHLFVKEVDEALLMRKHQLQRHLNALPKEVDIRQWEDLDGDMKVRPAMQPFHGDSLYESAYFDSLVQEWAPYRELSSQIMVHQKPYRVLIHTSLLESEDLVYGIVQLQAGLLLLLLMGMLLLNRSIAKKIWRPFYQTVEQLQRFEVDKNPTIQLAPTNIVEFEDLNRAIGLLAEKNHLVYQSQKEFTENAAHEMQTPLAILHGKLEMLLQSQDLSERQAHLIGSASEVVERLAKLNKHLLLLAKIENDQFGERESLDLSRLVTKMLHQFQESLDSKQLTLQLQTEPCLLEVNSSLLEILLSNLLGNAIRHNHPQGTILVSLRDRRLVIQNTGKPLRVPPQRLFERFQKDHANPQSTGLGLAIVKKIGDRYGWHIQYTYQNKLHQIQIDF